MADSRHKLFYDIKEVSDILGVAPSQLRYWEREFPQLAPKRGGRSVRHYTANDLDILKKIVHLLKTEGLTIQGARARMAAPQQDDEIREEALQGLKKVRQQLLSLKNLLSS